MKKLDQIGVLCLALWAGDIQASPESQARLISAAQLDAAPRIVPVLSSRRYLAGDDGLLVREILTIGSEWAVFRPTRAFSPVRSSTHSAADVWGMLPVARVRVVDNDERGSRLIMTDWLQEVRPGDRLLTVATSHLQAVSGTPPVSARVLGGLQERAYLASDDWLVLDRGASHGLAAGQRWRIQRGLLGRPLVADIEVKSTSAQVSLARVIRSQGPIQAGDVAERIAH
ncbi:hypothetical protein [Photobacterium galatheae]|uniref:Uncharacterized protein n=1 Tax=Photobacterium galatheae TaxID=1654360 RepID=A0A066RLU4_9GAMM|nr:hypothetical protein [Photobacterium galatheae]KDM91420.1 hypothetical protein EA58_11695 [Photobacterium galatheae]MCM0151101.1 hypothetical protein [Photobacterium galatheae]